MKYPRLSPQRRAPWLLVLVCAAACGGDEERGDSALSGGEGTVFDTSRMAFALPLANIEREHRGDFFTGNALFNRNWVTAPASTTGLDGLGPTFNARSCSGCHFKDGRGAPPTEESEEFEGESEAFLGLLIRLSVPGEGEHGGPLPEPGYGGQFNHRAILGVPAEGRASVAYDEVAGEFDDGTRYTLREPHYTFHGLAFGPMSEEVLISPRVAPPVFGLGLLEAVPEQTIVARADPDDADGDGISGRENRVWDPKSESTQLGRLGWKANEAGLEQQITGAFLGDIGITSALHPSENCPAPQVDCREAPSGGEPEIDAKKIAQITHYHQFLAVPARRDVNEPRVVAGEALFAELGCADCHTPTLKTGADASFPELENQTIHPYTDLLLHDMGEGLADGRPDYLADGNEWRTPPLWGIGLVETVNRHTFFLHDGRARNLEEAIIWHGGEAEASRDSYRALSQQERSQLLAFLGSL